MAVAKYNSLSVVRKAASTLRGILNGVAMDGEIRTSEAEFLSLWMKANEAVLRIPSFQQLAVKIYDALEDGVIDDEERADIIWLCDKYLSENLGYDETSDALRELHGILGGVIADEIVNIKEVRGVLDWINENEFLRGSWPYDEVESLLTEVVKDNKVSEAENTAMLNFFSEFVRFSDDTTLTAPSYIKANDDFSVKGIIAINPDIIFDGAVFVFTGESHKAKRADISKVITEFGGSLAKHVTLKTQYVIVGAKGNDCWQYSTYGRKIEEAIKLRKTGHGLQIIHEIDFWDAM